MAAAVGEFNEIILAAGRRRMPAGFVRKYVPLYAKEIKLLMPQRRLLRRPTAQGVAERIKEIPDMIKSRL